MPEGKKKKKQSKTAKAQSPEQMRLLELLPLLRDAEQRSRGRYQSISGYQLNRSTSESMSLTDSLRELNALEVEVASLLDGLDQPEVAELTVHIAQLVDAGSSDFFSGSRRADGKLVMLAARRALCRRGSAKAAGDEDDADDADEDVSEMHSEGVSDLQAWKGVDKGPCPSSPLWIAFYKTTLLLLRCV